MTTSLDLPHPEHLAAQAAEDAAYCRRVVLRLIDLGAELALTVQQQALAAPETAAAATVPFDRVACSVRRSMLLLRKLAEPWPTPAASHRIAARSRIIRDVEDAIQRTDGDKGDGEALHEELLERLDGPDLEDDIEGRPVAEIIADICRDLGIASPPGAHPWRRRTPEDIALLRARAASPCGGSPGATSPPNPVEDDPTLLLHHTRFRGK